MNKKKGEYDYLVKPNMTRQEITNLGNIILKDKIEKIKYKLFRWYYDRKTKNENKKKV